MSPIERSAGGGGGGFTNPMTTKGDIIIESATPAPARLAIGTTGQALEVSSGGLPAWQAPPGFEFDYVERNTDLVVANTTAPTADTWISGNAVTYDGTTRIKIETGSPEVGVATASADVFLVVWEGATNLCAIATAGVTITQAISCYGAVFFTPSAGAHTYTMKAWKTAAGSTVTIRGGASTGGGYGPAWYRITKA